MATTVISAGAVMAQPKFVRDSVDRWLRNEGFEPAHVTGVVLLDSGRVSVIVHRLLGGRRYVDPVTGSAAVTGVLVRPERPFPTFGLNFAHHP
jgi:hypothetical protein